MPWIKVWLHFVWSTKDRHPYLTDEVRQRVFDHIRGNAKAKDIYIDFITGWVDHVHCLIITWQQSNDRGNHEVDQGRVFALD
jgi:putative transposase